MTSQSTVQFSRARSTLVAGVAIALVFAGPLACKKKSRTTGPRNDGLTETYVSKNGLVTAHYPSTFAAKTAGKSVIMLSRNLSVQNDGTHQAEEVVAFVSIEKPISDELTEVNRVMLAAEMPTMTGYKTISSLPATCHGNPGIETIGTWSSNGAPFNRNECVFFQGKHAYSFAWNVTTAVAADEEPLLRSIREAAEISP